MQELEATRKAQGLTQKMLAHAAGVSLRSYQRLEQGDNQVAIGTLRRVLSVLGLELRFAPVHRPTLDDLANIYGHEDK